MIAVLEEIARVIASTSYYVEGDCRDLGVKGWEKGDVSEV